MPTTPPPKKITLMQDVSGDVPGVREYYGPWEIRAYSRELLLPGG